MEIGFLVAIRVVAASLLVPPMLKAYLVYSELPDCQFKSFLRLIIVANSFFIIWFAFSALALVFQRSGIEGFGTYGGLVAGLGALGLVMVMFAMTKVRRFIDV